MLTKRQSGRDLPTIRLEAGYSDNEEKLYIDADMLLNGMEGTIGVVIIIKIKLPGPDQAIPQDGYVEAFGYDNVKNTTRKIRY